MTTPQAEPKKSSCLAIGGVGCLVIIILLAIGGGAAWWKFGPQAKEWIADFQKDPERAAAMIILKLNPDIEIINEDAAKKMVTFKVKSTGEVITATFAALAKSRMTYVNGKTDISGLERTAPEGAAATPPPAPVPPLPAPAPPPPPSAPSPKAP